MKSMLAESPREAYEKFKELVNHSMLAWDTETTGLQVRNGYDTPRIIQFAWRPWTEALVVPVTDEFVPFIEYVFQQAEQMVGHNVKFDMHAIANAGIYVMDYFAPTEVNDTLWVARLHDERTSAKLKDLGTRYLHDAAAREQAKLKRLMKKHGYNWSNVPVSYLVQYGGEDAIMTGQIFDMLKPKIKYADEAYEREQRLQPILFRMERTGLTVDQEMLDAQTEKYGRRAEEAEAFMDNMMDGLNPRSPMQVKAAMRDLGLEVPNTQAATLHKIAGGYQDPPEKAQLLAQKMLEYRSSHKIHATYLTSWQELVKPTGRLHPWFSSMGTKTGRFSSSDPNMQNVKRGHELRDIFIAKPGHKMVVADWNQMELRLYAHFAEDENMRAAFISGDDIYQQAADLLGVSRQVGKMIMLASIYGAGPRALKRQCINMALKDGAFDELEVLESYDWGDLYDTFHEKYRIKQLAQKTETVARSRQLLDGDAHIRTVGGRRQRPKLVYKKKINGRKRKITIFKDLANSLVQGSSADMMKESMIQVAEGGALDYLRLTVHDEMVAEVPDDEVEEVEELMKEKMYRGQFVPPLTVEASHAERYGDAK